MQRFELPSKMSAKAALPIMGVKLAAGLERGYPDFIIKLGETSEHDSCRTIAIVMQRGWHEGAEVKLRNRIDTQIIDMSVTPRTRFGLVFPVIVGICLLLYGLSSLVLWVVSGGSKAVFLILCFATLIAGFVSGGVIYFPIWLIFGSHKTAARNELVVDDVRLLCIATSEGVISELAEGS